MSLWSGLFVCANLVWALPRWMAGETDIEEPVATEISWHEVNNIVKITAATAEKS
jgi:hypothetical protein